MSDWNFFGDEIATVDSAADRYTSIINPAYYALVLVSFKILGVSEFAARLPAMLLGVLSVPVFYYTWRNIIGRNAAFIGALLIVFSSWHLYFSQFSRFYTGAFLFGSLAYYLFYQALLHDDLKRLAGALLAAGIGFLFHATVAMVPVACALYAVLVLIARDSSPTAPSRRVAKVYLALCAVAAIFALGVLWDIWQDRQERGIGWGDAPSEMILQIVRQIQLPIVIAAVFGLAVLMRRNGWLGLYFLTGIAVPFVFVVVAAAFLNSRAVYLFYSLPLFLALAGVLCEQVRQALADEHRLVSHALTALLLVMLLPEMLSHYAGRRSLDVRDAVAFVDAKREPEDVVLSFANEFEYYARDKYPVEYISGGSNSSVRDWSQEIISETGGHGHAWIVVERWRKPIAPKLESWLTEHGKLVWRRFEKRYDYTVRGYEIFRVDLAQSADARRR